MGIGGHELPGQRVSFLANYFPNLYEYNIVGKLAESYSMIIESSHLYSSVFNEQDAIVIKDWWNTKTGNLDNDGDRCIFGSGDNMFDVGSAMNAWTNPQNRQYPTIDDRFAGGGPGPATPGTYTYPIDGGCPGPNRFDGLTKMGTTRSAGTASLRAAGRWRAGCTSTESVSRTARSRKRR